ncbi:polysaccharide deacetylase family protein [Parvularcula lutaonensis]|uniref:Chitooligosaccharide deacetylase n=1 Tax=Parvularcula lutaonensis TaxID=491923 RepID=A0ABV7M8D0_9PROT|nr:polysaccharide deacetylase family protein [Parvularcula lutaonensis]GGY44439.1 hypothetical protein GCM10007148_11680 [Parvularcula lutaonensis]
MTRAGDQDRLPILTYHSISDGDGPTCTPPEVFREQMSVIAALGWSPVTVADAIRWRKGEANLPEKALLITFDDGFQDYAEIAAPILEDHHFPAVVFLPTAVIGERENWSGANDPARPLMDWETVRRLQEGVTEFAPHSRHHANLPTLGDENLEDEVAGSKRELKEKTGIDAVSFAQPYGATDDRVEAAIARHYDIAFGVELGVATRSSPVTAMPRLEMYYYRDVSRWRAFLAGEGGGYLKQRQFLRSVRNSATRILQAAGGRS